MKTILTRASLLLLFTIQLSAFTSSAPKQMSSYYVAPSQNLSMLIYKLQSNGFRVLATTDILENSNVITITNQELQNTNSYLATLQINVTPHSIRVQNPSYFAAAYLGSKYQYGQFKNTLYALKRALIKLEEGVQKADFASLSDYCFMYGLPTQKDMLSIKKSPKLLNKITRHEAEEFIAYRLTLPNGSVLVGHKLRQKTNDFLKILGQEENAQILPYEAIINGDEVSIMNPKYYLTLSLPMLTLQEFMEIASTPDRIYKNIQRAYQ